MNIHSNAFVYMCSFQLQRKVEKLKGKLNNLETVEQLNKDLQQELLNLKQSQSKAVVSSSLKGIERQINPKMSDDEVIIYLILYM